MTNSTKVTGRTPWDFGAELLPFLGKVGPSIIVVAGFLFFAYLFYQEINKTRVEVDKQLQQRLETAQQQLVGTYEKMGGMSDQLIKNIKSLMELNAQIDKDVEKNRKKLMELEKQSQHELKTVQQELAAARADASQAKKELAQIQTESDRLQAKAQQQLRDLEQERKKLEVNIANLNDEKSRLEKDLTARAMGIADYKKKLAFLAEQVKIAPGGVIAGTPEGLVEPFNASEQLRQILARYVSNPDSITGKDVGPLVGLDAQVLEELAAEGLGYAIWLKWDNGEVVGYTQQDELGYGPYIIFKTASGTISGVVLRGGYHVVTMPKVENWYERWVAGVRSEGDIVLTFYIDLPYLPNDWTLQSIIVDNPSLERVLYGSERPHEFLEIRSFRERFVNVFEKWSTDADAFGRPSLIVRMQDRSNGFNASQLPGMSTGSLPSDLRPVVIAVLNAAVRDDKKGIEKYLHASITRDILGQLAAVALRDGARVIAVAETEFTTEDVAPTESVEIILSFAAIRREEKTRIAILEFARFQGTWALTNVEIKA